MEHETKIVELLKKNRSLLFVGSGFSSESLDLKDNNLPMAYSLSHTICKAINIKESDNLTYSSEKFLDEKGELALINLLQETLTVQEVSSNQKGVCSLDWMRIYTTNYDDTIEQAYRKNGKYIESVDTESDKNEFIRRKNICIHLNGMLRNLNEDSLNSSFKLTDSSYASYESFSSSEWSYIFNNDLERASIILFVGYSLYDIDIKKILKLNKEFKSKTFFIVHDKVSEEDEYILSKYGTVLKIGLSGIASIIVENSDLIKSLQDLNLSFLTKYDPKPISNNINIDDESIRNMLVFGKYDNSIISSKILSGHQPYFVLREDLTTVYTSLKEGFNVIIRSRLGNGKSFFLEQVKAFLHSKGDFDIYDISSQNIEIYNDIEKINRTDVKAVLLIDNYDSYLDLIKYILENNFNNILIVLTVRTANHIYSKDHLPNTFNYRNIDIDFLNINETDDLVSMINNLGSWNYLAHLNNQQKNDYIKKNYNNEISSFLTGMYSSQLIKDKLKEIYISIEKKEFKLTVFALLLCNKLGIKPNRALIANLTANDAIYSPEFEKSEFFRNIFELSQGVIYGSSSVFATFIIENFFEPSFTADNYLKIAENLDRYGYKKDAMQQNISTNLFKFSFIQSSLPEREKIPTLTFYYQELKKRIKWLESNPHFWVQYAMCHIASKKYNKAQELLNTSYSLAERKINYNVYNIDNQQVRLWLLECSEITDGNIVFSRFTDANSKLNNNPEDVFKFRRLNDYIGFHENNFHKLSKTNKVYFVKLINQQKKSLEYLISQEGSELSEYTFVCSLISSFEKIASMHSVADNSLND